MLIVEWTDCIKFARTFFSESVLKGLRRRKGENDVKNKIRSLVNMYK